MLLCYVWPDEDGCDSRPGVITEHRNPSLRTLRLVVRDFDLSWVTA